MSPRPTQPPISSTRPSRALTLALIATAWLAHGSARAALPEEGGTVGDVLSELDTSRRSLDALAPLAALEAELSWAPGAVAHATLARIADARDTHPLVAARVEALLLTLDVAGGRGGPARTRATERLGLLTAWRLAAQPDPSTPCDEAEPPDGRWIDADGLFPDGIIHLDSLLGSGDETGSFATARIVAEAPLQAVLRIGASGPTTVWVDGAVVAEAPELRARVLDQIAVPLQLPPGIHSVVVRVCADADEGASLMARVTDRRGRPERRVSAAQSDPASTEAAPPAAPARFTPEDPWATWVARATSAKTEATRRRAVRVLATSGRELPPELTPAALLGDDTDSLLLRALLETEVNRRVELLRRVLDQDGERVLALLELADSDLARQRYLAARALLDEADARAPGLIRSRVLRARLLSENQVPGEALRLLRDASKAAPGVPAVLSALGSLAYQQNAMDSARGAFDELATVALDPTETGFWVFEVARLQGRVDDALRASDRLIAARPDVGGHRLMKARTLADLGRPDDARRVLQEIPAALRGSPDLLEGIGRLLHRLGDEDDALTAMRESLRLRPQNPDLRAAIARLQPDQERPEDAWLEDPAVLLKAPVAEGAPDTEILLDQTIVRVFPNGLSVSTWQRVVRVNRVANGDGTRDVHIPYDPFKHAVDVLRSEVLRADGTVRPVTEREEQSLSEAWYGLYYDLRHIIVPFRDLHDGDVLVLRYRVSDVGRNLINDSFSNLALLADVALKRRVQYVLLTPPGRSLHAALIDPTGKARWTDEEGAQGELHYRVWEMEDLPALVVEDQMPGYAEVSPWIHVSSFADYAEVGRTWRALVAPQEQITAAMRAHVHALVDGVADPMERVRILHNDLVRSNRYVGLEFGIHGYKPYPAAQIFERRFGDCKDQSMLLKVMLAEAGIEARLVLVRTRSLGQVPEQPASLDVFDHAICQVPSLGLWLDPTAESNGLHELPAEDQGATALVVDASGGHLVVLPESDAVDNVRSRELVVEPGSTGDAVRGSLVTGGLFSPELRKAYRTRATRDALLSEQLGALYPGFRLGKATFEGIDDLQSSVGITFEGKAPDVTEATGGAIVLPSPDPADDWVRRYAQAPTRQQDLLIDNPYVDRRVERLVAPPGWEPAVEAHVEEVVSDWGTFTIYVGALDGAAVRERKMELRVRRVRHEDWGAFREFLRKADALGRLPLSLRPIAAAGGQS